MQANLVKGNSFLRVIALLALVIGMMLPNASVGAAPMAITNIVTPGSPDWGFVNDNGTTGDWTAGFMVGPGTPPLGTSSIYIQLNSAGAGIFFAAQKYQGVRLADITELSYSTYTNLSPAAMSFQFNYDPDLTTSEATWYGRLTYEPYMNGTVTDGVWQTWDMINGGSGMWWASPNNNSPVDNSCPQSAPCTLTNLLSLYPNIGIRNDANSAIGFKAGSNWNGFYGNVDNFTITTGGNTDTYDFDLPSTFYVDDSWAGTTPGTDPDGAGPAVAFGSDAFAVIQDAIDAASDGNTVNVLAGTYVEQLTITKDLILTGAGAGSSIVSAPASLPTSGNQTSTIVRINGAGVDVELTGFTITGPGPSSCGSILAGITVSGGANANIHHNSILDIRDNPFSGCQNGIGIFVGRQSWSTTGTATIANNIISGYQKAGIVVDNTGSSAIITDNTISGTGTTSTIAQNGIQISRGATATLSGNTVSGNSFHLAGSTWDWGSAGILLWGAGDVTLAGGNTLANNDQNLYIDSATNVTVGAETIGPSSAPLDFGYNVINLTSLNLDLSGVTFPGTTDNFDIEDWIWHGVDDPASGLVTWVPGNLFVTPLSGSIQAAVDLASPGDTVNVDAGTYDEQVVINKLLTLTGIGNTTILRPSQTTASTFTLYNRKSGGPLNSAGIIVTDTTESVTVSNLKIDGSLVTSVPTGANGFMGILYRGNPGTIDHVTVADMHAAGGAAGLGMFVSGFDVPVSVTVSNSTITGYNKNGLTASYANLSISITGNTITGMGPTTLLAQNGIQVGYGATGRISGNTISGNVYTSTYGGTNDPATDVEADGATGILLYIPGSGVEIETNTLTGNQFGVWTVAAPDVNIHDNAITGLAHTGTAYPTGIAIGSADMWTVGLGGSETATAATISNNVISTGDYGVLVIDYNAGGAAPTASVSGNTFSNNSVQVMGTGSSVLDIAATLTGNTFDRAVTVNHLGTLLHAIWGKIQLAINAASAGDTVIAEAGTYVENVNINKSVTLHGAGTSTIVVPALSAPNPCSGSSLCPGASNVLLVAANNVVIHDLIVDGDNPALTSSYNVGGANLDARNGIITDHTTGNYSGLEVYNVTVRNIYLRGIYSSTAAGNFNIHHNTVTNVQAEYASIAIFAWYGPGTMANNTVSYANDAISANHSKGIQFLNNTVTHSLSGVHTDNASSGGGVADLLQGNNVDCSGTSGAYGVWTFNPYIAPTVNNNTVTNCDIGLSAWGSRPGIVSQFTNNTVTGNLAAGGVGAYVTTSLAGWGYSDVSANFSGNIITGYETGVFLDANQQTWETQPYVAKTINATFSTNQIYGNTAGAGKGTTGTYTNNFNNNWWGNGTGPSGVGTGTGDSVVAGINYTYWCRDASCTTFAPSTLISPIGVQTTWNNVFHWTGYADATWYKFEVVKADGTPVYSRWYTLAQAACAGIDCQVSPDATRLLPPGDYKWRIQDYGPYTPGGDYRPWSAYGNFTISGPNVVVLNSPIGTQTTWNKAFNWTGLVNATWYRIEVRKADDTVILTKWYTIAQACSGTACQVTPDETRALPAGDYKWRIQDYGGYGYGVWTAFTNFTLPAPAVAVLNTPTGTQTTWNNIFSWTGLANATWYRIEVRKTDETVVFTKWYTIADACSGTACQVSPTETRGLPAGDYKWRIQDYGGYGYGVWTAYTNFTLPAPNVVVLNAPTGTQTTWNNIFSWTGLTNATWYKIEVRKVDDTVVFTKWYTISPACSGTACQVSPAETLGLPAGDYKWRIQDYGGYGYGFWTIFMTFTIP